MMNTATALELLERGEARCVYTSILVLAERSRVWYSLDGEVWTETDDAELKKASGKDD